MHRACLAPGARLSHLTAQRRKLTLRGSSLGSTHTWVCVLGKKLDLNPGLLTPSSREGKGYFPSPVQVLHALKLLGVIGTLGLPPLSLLLLQPAGPTWLPCPLRALRHRRDPAEAWPTDDTSAQLCLYPPTASCSPGAACPGAPVPTQPWEGKVQSQRR